MNITVWKMEYFSLKIQVKDPNWKEKCSFITFESTCAFDHPVNHSLSKSRLNVMISKRSLIFHLLIKILLQNLLTVNIENLSLVFELLSNIPSINHLDIICRETLYVLWRVSFSLKNVNFIQVWAILQFFFMSCSDALLVKCSSLCNLKRFWNFEDSLRFSCEFLHET